MRRAYLFFLLAGFLLAECDARKEGTILKRTNVQIENSIEGFRERVKNDEPDNASASLGVANELYAQRRWREAVDAYRTYISDQGRLRKKTPKAAFNETAPDLQVAIPLGLSLLELNQLEEASELLLQALNGDPTSSEALWGLGRVEALQGHLNISMQHLSIAVSLNASNLHLRKEYAQILRKAQRPSEAFTQLAEALRIYPLDFEANLLSAEILLDVSQNDEAQKFVETAMRAGETSVDSLCRLGRAMVAVGLYAPSVQVLDRGMASSHNVECVLSKGDALLGMGQGQDAYNMYASVLKHDPPHSPEDQAEAYYRMGLLLFTAGQHETSAAHCQQAIKANGKHAPAHLQLAKAIYASSHNRELAASFARQALSIQPTLADVHVFLGLMALENNDIEQAQSELSAAISNGNKHDFIAEVKLAALYEDRGLYTNASALYSVAMYRYVAPATLGLVRCLVRMGDYAMAEEHLLRLIRANVSMGEALLELGHIKQQGGDLNLAARHYTHAIVDGRLHKSALTEAYWRLSTVHETRGNRVDAENTAKAAIQLRKDYGPAYEVLARLAFADGKGDRAVAYYEEAAKTNHGRLSAQGYLQLGHAYEQNNMVGKAREMYAAAIETEPSLAEAYQSAGNLLYRSRMVEESAEMYRKAVELNPSCFEALLRLGTLSLQSGHHADAVKYLLQALPLHNTNTNNEGDDIVGLLSTARRRLATEAISSGQWELARERLREAVTVSGKDIEARIALADLLNEHPNSVEDVISSIQHYITALSIAPSNSADTTSAILPKLIKALIANGNLKDAISRSRSWAEADPNSSEARHAVGMSLLALNQSMEAATLLYKAVQMNRGSPDYVCDLVEVLLAQGDVMGGMSLANEVLRMRPNCPRGLLLLGEAFRLQDRLDESANLVRMALSLDRQYGRAWVMIADLILQAKGKEQEVLDLLEQATIVDPMKEDAYKRLAHVYMGDKDDDRAMKHFAKLSTKVSSPWPHFYIANLYRKRGDREAALVSLKAAASLNTREGRIAFEYGNVLKEEGLFLEAYESFKVVTSLNPYDVPAQYLMGVTAESSGDLDRATKHYRRAIELTGGGNHASALQKYGSILLRQGKIEEAESVLVRSLQLDDSNVDIWKSVGRLSQVKGETANAMTAYRGGLQRDPNDGDCWFALGMILLERNSTSEAEEALKHAISQNSSSIAGAHRTSALETLGTMAEQRGDWRDALQYLLEAGHPHMTNVTDLIRLATLYRSNGSLDKAVVCFHTAYNLNPHPDILNAMGVVLQRLGRFSDATEAFTAARDFRGQSPSSEASSYNNLGSNLQIEGRLNEAIEMFKVASKMDPTLTVVYVNLGSLYEQMNRLTEAMEQYEQAIRSAPNDPDNFVRMAIVLRKVPEETERAKAFYLEALKRNPRFSPALFGLASLLLENSDTAEEGLYRLEEALYVDPSNDEALLLMASTTFKRGDLLQTIELLERLVTANPNHATALQNIGVTLHASGRSLESLEYFRRSLQANPRDSSVYVSYARVLRVVGKRDLAVDILKKACQMLPSDLTLRYTYAEELALAGKLKLALKQCTSLLQENPVYPGGEFLLGQIHIQLSNNEEARKAFVRSILTEPSRADSYNLLGVACFNLEDYHCAYQNFEKTLELNPSHPDAKKNKDYLQVDETGNISLRWHRAKVIPNVNPRS